MIGGKSGGLPRRLERYWRARLDWNSALVIAQEDDVADANTFAKCDREQSNVICGLWRVALVGQMLSPVPDAAAVEWKRAHLKAGQHRFVATVTEEQIQRSIDQDVQWLQAHPTRRHAKKGAAND